MGTGLDVRPTLEHHQPVQTGSQSQSSTHGTGSTGSTVATHFQSSTKSRIRDIPSNSLLMLLLLRFALGAGLYPSTELASATKASLHNLVRQVIVNLFMFRLPRRCVLACCDAASVDASTPTTTTASDPAWFLFANVLRLQYA